MFLVDGQWWGEVGEKKISRSFILIPQILLEHSSWLRVCEVGPPERVPIVPKQCGIGQTIAISKGVLSGVNLIFEFDLSREFPGRGVATT